MKEMIENPERGETPADSGRLSLTLVPKNLYYVERALVERLAAEIERLLAALKPFSDAAESAEDDEADSYGLDCSSARYELTIGDLKLARETYTKRLTQ